MPDGKPTIFTAMRTEDVIEAYARWAPVYDIVFGPVLKPSRMAALAALPPGTRRVLEVGVGTGLCLPDYPPHVGVVGIDLSARMLSRARARVRRQAMTHVEGLHEMDAAELTFADDSFDVAMAMYVITVAPDPVGIMAEMRRVVKPGGRILAVGHFASDAASGKPASRALTAFSRLAGWSTTVSASQLRRLTGLHLLSNRPAGLLGVHRLLEFQVEK